MIKKKKKKKKKKELFINYTNNIIHFITSIAFL